MLKFRIRDIPCEGKETTVTLDPSWYVATMSGIEGAWEEATGEVALSLSRTGSEVLARGEILAHLSSACGRCLTAARLDVRSEFATTFVPAGVTGADGEALDDPDIETYEGEVIDLRTLVREHVLLGIPMSPLCKPDCLGLCPRCGAELNSGPCGCVTAVDSRREALGAVKAPR